MSIRANAAPHPYRNGAKRIQLASVGGFLIEENKFEKILFPKQRYASSLYKAITRKYFADLSNPATLRKISK